MSNSIISFALLGDVSLHGHWSDPANGPFGPMLAEKISGHDVVLLNLESAALGNDGQNDLKLPRLSTTPEAIQALRSIKPTVCVLGNNHFFDHLEDGLRRTQEAVRDIGANTVGVGFNRQEASRPARFRIRDLDISVLSYVADDTHPSLPPGDRVYFNRLDVDTVTEEVARERREGRFVIVSLHWGQEFEAYPTPAQRAAARRMAEAGAGLIWGHHAHICQGWEMIDGTPIFYCMGNSVFDDVSGMSIPWSMDGRRSLLVSLQASELGVQAESIKVDVLERPDVKSTPVQIPSEALPRRLTRPLGHQGYGLFYRLYKVGWRAKQARTYFLGPGRNPLRQAIRLPGRLMR